MKKSLLFFLLFLPCLAFAAVYPKNIPSKALKDLSISEINALFTEANIEYKKPAIVELADELGKKLNGQLLIAQNDEIIVEGSYGYKRLNNKTEAQKITLSTRFELASVSKEFTAAAVLQLVNAGKISLKDPVKKYIPELPYEGITIHHLLCHASGLPEYFHFPDEWFNTDNMMANEDVVKVLVERKPDKFFEPNKGWRYTNTNYALLALIVKKVSGMSFPEYVKKNIFTPAGMTHSFYITERSKQNDYATGHEKDAAPLPVHFMDGTVGDKGLYSNVDDLFAWKKAYFKYYKILPKNLVETATRQQNKLDGNAIPEKPYGYGWRLEDNKEYGKIIYHGGLWHGFQHLILYQPAENIFMVFLSNYKNSAHKGKSNEVLHILCGA